MEYKVAWFYGGGGCAGFVDVGAISAAEDLEIPLTGSDVSVNTESVGTLFGSGAALGRTSKEMRYFLERENLLYRFLVPKKKELLNALHGKPLFPDHNRLERIIKPFYRKNWKMKDIPNLNVFATDPRTYERVIINKENYPDVYLDEAIMASSALPGLFNPYMEMIDGGLAKGSSVKEFLSKNYAEQTIVLTLMDHPANILFNYLMTSLGKFKGNHDRENREKSRYLRENSENLNIIHVGYKVPPWHFLDTSQKNINHLRRLGRKEFIEAYVKYEIARENLGSGTNYATSSA